MSSRYLRTVPEKSLYRPDLVPGRAHARPDRERWTLLILRDLLLKGPQRFQDLQNSLAGAAPNTLPRASRRWRSRGWSRGACTASIRPGSRTS